MIEHSKSIQIEKARFATKTIESLYRFTIPNSQVLMTWQNYLLERPDISTLLYFNHITFPDPVFALWLYQKYLNANLSRRVVVPASHLHTRFAYNPAFASAFCLGQLFYGFEGVRLVQNYMVGDRYTQEQAINSYKQLIKTIKNPSDSKPVGLIIAPEGHRADDGFTLQAGNDGLISLAKMMAPVLMLPLGISYSDRSYQRNGLNFGHSVRLNLGSPIVVEHRNDSHLKLERFMMALASTLPEEMRGQWR